MNGMNFLRGSRHDYDEWEKEGCSGWSYNDVLPYFKKMENVEIPEYRDSRVYNILRMTSHIFII